MAWGSKDLIANALDIVGTEQYATARSLNPGSTDRIHVKTNSDGTTDSLVVSVYPTLDTTSEEWATVSDYSFVLDATDGADNIVQFDVSGPRRYRIGLIRQGSTDTLTTSVWAMNDGIDLS